MDSGVTGFIVDPDDAQDLTQRLIELAESPALGHKLGQAALAKVQHWHPQAIAKQILNSYTEALNRRSTP